MEEDNKSNTGHQYLLCIKDVICSSDSTLWNKAGIRYEVKGETDEHFIISDLPTNNDEGHLITKSNQYDEFFNAHFKLCISEAEFAKILLSPERIAVHCKTQDEADKFCDCAERIGLTWGNRNSDIPYSDGSGCWCREFDTFSNEGGYCFKSYYEDQPSVEVIDFETISFNNEINKESGVTTCGDTMPNKTEHIYKFKAVSDFMNAHKKWRIYKAMVRPGGSCGCWRVESDSDCFDAISFNYSDDGFINTFGSLNPFDYSIEGFTEKFLDKSNKICVHVSTEEEAEAFCKWMHNNELCWCNDDSYISSGNCYREYRSNTCYTNSGSFADVMYYERGDWTIIEHSDVFGKCITDTITDTDNKQKEEGELMYEVNYEVVRPFNFKAILNAMPCNAEKEKAEIELFRNGNASTDYFDSYANIKDFECVKDNINWLLDEGFIKEVKEQFKSFDFIFHIEDKDELVSLISRLRLDSEDVNQVNDDGDCNNEFCSEFRVLESHLDND